MGSTIGAEVGRGSSGTTGPFFVLLPRNLETDGYGTKYSIPRMNSAFMEWLALLEFEICKEASVILSAI